MKRILMIAFTGMLLTTIFSSCNKDIPKDIPDWLREKIKEIKKETKEMKKNGTIRQRSVAEYSNGNVTLYYYNPDTNPGGNYIYDKDGNELCFHSPGISSSPCGPYTFNEILISFTKIRTIWMS